MKKTKLANLLVGGALIFAGIITGCGKGNTASDIENYGFGSWDQLPGFESLTGTTEFYFRPAGDNRIWHVVNKYNPIGSNEGPDYNVSSYTFTSDSVYVINEFAGVPETGQWDLSLSGLALYNINNNKQN